MILLQGWFVFIFVLFLLEKLVINENILKTKRKHLQTFHFLFIHEPDDQIISDRISTRIFLYISHVYSHMMLINQAVIKTIWPIPFYEVWNGYHLD